MMTSACRLLPTRIRGTMLSQAACPLRFAGTGGTAGAVQVLLLVLFTRQGWHPVLANGVAFLLATQINFGLSITFTWRDRQVADSLPRRWVLFHGSIALMALGNMLIFAITRSFLPVAGASLAGIASGALGNYLLGDRLVFRSQDVRRATPEDTRAAA